MHSKNAKVIICVTTSPSRYQILANIPEEEEKDNGEILQEDGPESDDKFNLRPVIQGVMGEDLKLRNLRPRSKTKVVRNCKENKNGNDKKEDKKVNGNDNNSKASGRKY